MTATDFEVATSFLALVRAARRAARGKRDRPEVAAFLSDLEREVLQLERELLDGVYAPGPYRTFTIYEPKERTISAAPFRDRVVHHAVCAVLEPRLERAALPASFACRPGLGPVASVVRVRALARAHRYVLRLDVRRFFASVDHAVLLGALDRKIDDPRLYALVERIVRAGAPQAESGRGLPIGSLTSQHFANFYLAPLDGLIARTLRASHVRYMDDIAVFGGDKGALWTAHRLVGDFLRARLHLELKPTATRLLPVEDGVPWLGLRVWPRQVRLDRAHRARLVRQLRALGRRLDAGRATEEILVPRAAGILSYAANADTHAWCRAFFARRAEDRRRTSRREVEDER